MPPRALALLVGIFLGACGVGNSDLDKAETTYASPIDATEALAAPVVAAEDSLYLGRRVTVDGRITAIRASGCEVHLNTDETPLVVTSPRTGVEGCAWQVPEDTQGFAVAAGTLRTAVDTLRLTANGMRVTPVRVSSLDS